MNKLLGAILLSVALLTPMWAAAPQIVQTKAGAEPTFHVTFDKGAIAACTVYYRVDATEPKGDINFPDGHYAPKHCWLFPEDGKTTSYNDDFAYIIPAKAQWNVFVQLQYGLEGGKVVESNTLRVTY